MNITGGEHSRTINTKWHLKNRMADYLEKYKKQMKKEEIRGLWHRNHLRNCKCRTDVPEDLKKYLN